MASTGNPQTFSPLAMAASRLLRRVRPAPVASGLCTLCGLTRRKPHPTRHGIFSVSPSSMMGTNLLSVGEYEPRMIAVLQKYLKPGGVFIDLGANEGYFSVIASGLVGAGGRVIAVEPQSRLQPVIQENLRLNNCANVEIQHILLSATDGESELVLTPQLNTGASSIAPLHMKLRRIMPTEHVASLTLASFLAQAAIPRCDLIKIDIEGAEWDVLMNAGETLRSGILRNIALEIHNSILAARGINGMEIHPFILGCGYTLDDSLGHWVYTKTN